MLAVLKGARDQRAKAAHIHATGRCREELSVHNHFVIDGRKEKAHCMVRCVSEENNMHVDVHGLDCLNLLGSCGCGRSGLGQVCGCEVPPSISQAISRLAVSSGYWHAKTKPHCDPPPLPLSRNPPSQLFDLFASGAESKHSLRRRALRHWACYCVFSAFCRTSHLKTLSLQIQKPTFLLLP